MGKQCLSPPHPEACSRPSMWDGWKENQVPVTFPLAQRPPTNPSGVSSHGDKLYRSRTI